MQNSECKVQNSELRILKWRNVVGLHHTPLSRREPFSKQTRHASPVDIPWCSRSDLHRHWTHFKCVVSALDYVGELVPREGFAPPTFPF